MAFGIDDALHAAAAALSITETFVETIKRYQREKKSVDLEQLIEEVRSTALKRVDGADLALTRFERMLVEKGVDLNRRLVDVIAGTSFWRPFEQYRLKQIRRLFHEFSDSIYSGCDDIAALVRCHSQSQPMGVAVIESTKAKHHLHAELLQAPSFKAAIDLLRKQLARHKAALIDSTG